MPRLRRYVKINANKFAWLHHDAWKSDFLCEKLPGGASIENQMTSPRIAAEGSVPGCRRSNLSKRGPYEADNDART